jgi:hypothetical protein
LSQRGGTDLHGQLLHHWSQTGKGTNYYYYYYYMYSKNLWREDTLGIELLVCSLTLGTKPNYLLQTCVLSTEWRVDRAMQTPSQIVLSRQVSSLQGASPCRFYCTDTCMFCILEVCLASKCQCSFAMALDLNLRLTGGK